MNNHNIYLEKDSESLALMRDASARDILDDLGPISKEEVDHYKSLSDFAS